jgi:hypothetical protein
VTEVGGANPDMSSRDEVEIVYETFTITSAAAATAVNIIPDARVGAGRKFYLIGFGAKVDGATVWATTANVKIQDTSAVDYVTMLVAALTANAEVGPFTAAVGEDAFTKGTGGTAAKGLQIKGDANGTGSNLVGWVYGIIK